MSIYTHAHLRDRSFSHARTSGGLKSLLLSASIPKMCGRPKTAVVVSTCPKYHALRTSSFSEADILQTHTDLQAKRCRHEATTTINGSSRTPTRDTTLTSTSSRFPYCILSRSCNLVRQYVLPVADAERDTTHARKTMETCLQR